MAAAVTHDAAQLRSHPPRRTDIAGIQSGLDGLWEDFNQDLRDGQTVTRACMSNLIVYCEHSRSEEILASVRELVQSHPARVVMLAANGEAGPTHAAEPGIDVYISGHYYALDAGWQVCAEQIHIIADDAAVRRLPSIARAQLVGDLPTTLWWASHQPPPTAGQLFFKLATMSDQIIYDSIGWTNPSKGMQAMSRWVTAERGEYVIFNLAWRRLKPWRSLLSQVLDPAITPAALQQVYGVTIEHGPHALAMASLLLGWIASRLNWKARDGTASVGKQTVWNFAAPGRPVRVLIKRLDAGAPTPYRLRWQWRDGNQEKSLVFALLADQRLGILEPGVDTPLRVIAAPDLEHGALVSAQMAQRTRDKLFEAALEAGNAMTSVLTAH